MFNTYVENFPVHTYFFIYINELKLHTKKCNRSAACHTLTWLKLDVRLICGLD